MKPLSPKEGDYPEHQFAPLEGGRYGTPIMGPPGTDIGTLPAEISDQDGAIVISSGWLPTPEQRRQLESGGHIRVSLWTYPMVPIAVALEPPICHCHGEDMVWDTNDGGYYCKLATATQNGQPRTALEQAHEDFTPEPADEDEED